MRGGVWLTLVLQDLNSNHCLLKGRREREKYHPPPHTHMQLTNCTPQQPAILPQPYIPDGPLSCFIQSPSRTSLSSPQLPQNLLDFQPFALCPPHIWNLLLGSPTSPDSKSTNFSQTHLLVCTEQICPSLIPQPTSFFLPCYSLCVSSPPLLCSLMCVCKGPTMSRSTSPWLHSSQKRVPTSPSGRYPVVPGSDFSAHAKSLSHV